MSQSFSIGKLIRVLFVCILLRPEATGVPACILKFRMVQKISALELPSILINKSTLLAILKKDQSAHNSQGKELEKAQWPSSDG